MKLNPCVVFVHLLHIKSKQRHCFVERSHCHIFCSLPWKQKQVCTSVSSEFSKTISLWFDTAANKSKFLFSELKCQVSELANELWVGWKWINSWVKTDWSEFFIISSDCQFCPAEFLNCSELRKLMLAPRAGWKMRFWSAEGLRYGVYVCIHSMTCMWTNHQVTKIMRNKQTKGENGRCRCSNTFCF